MTGGFIRSILRVWATGSPRLDLIRPASHFPKSNDTVFAGFTLAKSLQFANGQKTGLDH